MNILHIIFMMDIRIRHIQNRESNFVLGFEDQRPQYNDYRMQIITHDS